MSFGRNPHVAKAEAAELKAESATDAASYERAWRDAGRLWERAADRETDAKRRALYTGKAERARATADEPQVRELEPTDEADGIPAETGDAGAADHEAGTGSASGLN